MLCSAIAITSAAATYAAVAFHETANATAE